MIDKTILITRPHGDGAAMTEALHEIGARVVHEPLTEIMLLHDTRQALHHELMAEPDAVIVTSRHAVQALALLTEIRDIFLLCVGDATADTALSLGFTRVSAAGGNAQRLLDYIMDGYDTGSRFLYASATEVRVEIDEILANYGMDAGRIAVYEVIASEELSDIVIEQLKRGQIDAVTFMSNRSAEIFMKLLEKAGIAEATAQLHAFCLSDSIAEALDGWKSVHIASEATLASLVESVDNSFK